MTSAFSKSSIFTRPHDERKTAFSKRSTLESVFCKASKTFCVKLQKLKCGLDFVSRGVFSIVYLSDGDVPFFGVSLSPIFSRTGYQKKANFLEQVVKTYQKRKFCYNGLLFSQIFVFLSILFTDFF